MRVATIIAQKAVRKKHDKVWPGLHTQDNHSKVPHKSASGYITEAEESCSSDENESKLEPLCSHEASIGPRSRLFL